MNGAPAALPFAPEAPPYQIIHPSRLAEAGPEGGEAPTAAGEDPEIPRLRGEIIHRGLETLARGGELPGLAGLAAIVFVWALIALTFIDFDTQLLPDSITLPLLWLGLLLNLNGAFTSLPDAVVGAVAGYLVLWSVYWLFKLVTGKEGMGYGDFKLLAAIGAWLGWQLLPLVILLSSLVGAVVGIALIVIAKHGRNIPIPFGPYLAGGGLIALFWGQTLTQSYLQLLAQ